MKKACIVLLMILMVAHVGTFNLPVHAAVFPEQQDKLYQDGGSIPSLSLEQLQDLVTRMEYLPGSYQATATQSTYSQSMTDNVEGLRSSWPLAADRLDTIINQYGWNEYAGAVYDTCQPDRAIGGIDIEVSQLSSPEAARAFINDVGVRAYFEGLFFQLTDSTVVHGVLMTSIFSDSGECFDQEDLYYLMFEHWGLLFSVQVMAQAETDSALPIDMLNTIARQIIQVVDTQYAINFPATPVPAPATGSLTASLTLDNLERVLPSDSEVSLPAGTYMLNQDVSLIFSLADIVNAYQDLNLLTLANSLQQVGTTHGMIGQGVRLWTTIQNCPSIVGLSIELDVALFETDEGPVGFMNDPQYQQAWIDTGLLTSFVPQDDGSMLVFGSMPNYHCGSAKIVEKMIVVDRVLLTIAITTYDTVTDAEALDIVDAVGLFAIAKLKFAAPE
jgi:hypothetical protein